MRTSLGVGANAWRHAQFIAAMLTAGAFLLFLPEADGGTARRIALNLGR